MNAESAARSPVDDGRCFACGPLSEIGLHLRFRTNADLSVECDTVLAAPFQGWRGVAHGGIVAVLLDEAMAYAAAARGYLGVTASLSMRFRKPVPLGEPITVHAQVRWQRRSVFSLDASVFGAGTLLARAEGSFVGNAKLEPGQRLGETDGRS